MSQRVITFHYTLTNATGQELDSSRSGEPLAILEGVGQIIPGLEVHLRTMKTGEKRRVTVPARDAYGEVQADQIVEVPRNRLPTPQVKVGDRFRAGSDRHAPVVRVTKVTDTHVTLDANHELAGQDLTFDLEVTDVRVATADELAHGHVHGPGGHHH